MLKAEWLKALHSFLIYALAFTIPFPFIFSSVATILLLITWILTVDFKSFFINIKQRKWLWPWLAYFCFFALSYFYSVNKEQSLFDLTSKLSLLILPLCVGNGDSIGNEGLKKVFLSFILGTTVIGVYSITKSAIVWHETGFAPIMFYHNLVKGLDANAVYMAWYTLFSITILLFYHWKGTVLKYKSVRYLLILFQLTFFFLLSARMLILLFIILIVPIYLINTLKSKRFPILKVLSFILLIAGVFSLIVLTKNPIKDRYKNLFTMDLSIAWLDDYSNVEVNEFNNLTLRLFLWRIGVENVKEHNLWFFGAGNGDAQSLQNEKMREYKIKNIDKAGPEKSELYNANLHNMFLQTLLMVGIGGLLSLLIMVFSPFVVISTIDAKYIFLVFLISSFLFLFQESALQTQAGIIYFTFFMQIFWNTYYGQAQKKLIKILK